MEFNLSSIPYGVHIPHNFVTLFNEDNHASPLFAHAGECTQQSFHIDICHYVLIDWAEYDLLAIEDVAPALIPTDTVS